MERIHLSHHALDRYRQRFRSDVSREEVEQVLAESVEAPAWLYAVMRSRERTDCVLVSPDGLAAFVVTSREHEHRKVAVTVVQVLWLREIAMKCGKKAGKINPKGYNKPGNHNNHKTKRLFVDRQ